MEDFSVSTMQEPSLKQIVKGISKSLQQPLQAPVVDCNLRYQTAQQCKMFADKKFHTHIDTI